MTILAVLVLLIVALVLLRWWAPGPPPVREPCCARCGYAVRGLTSDICPECGSDLSLPGAVRIPHLGRGSGPVARIIMWSMVMAVLGVMATAISSEIPHALKQRWTWFVMLQAPPEFGYQYVKVDVSDTAWRESDLQQRIGTITFKRTDGTTATLNIDRSAMTMRGPTDSTERSISQATLRDWLVASGATGTPGQIDYQARVLQAAVNTLDISQAIAVQQHDDWTPVPGGRRLALIGGGGGSSGGPAVHHRTVQRIVGGGCFAVWILGCVVIVQRGRFRKTPAGS